MKTVFITEGATGIGAASVVKFAMEKWRVVFLDTNKEAALKLCHKFNGGNVVFRQGDIRNRAEVREAVSTAVLMFGGVDTVVVNAGMPWKNSLFDIRDEVLDEMIDVNIKGTIHTLQVTIPFLKERSGSIVINTSDQSLIEKTNNFAYDLTKGALEQITKSLAIHLGPYKVKVNAVCSGILPVSWADETISSRAELYKTETECRPGKATLFPLGRVETPEEIAELIYFLASDTAPFYTGGVFPVE